MVVVGVAFLKALNPWCDSYKKGPRREERNEKRETPPLMQDARCTMR